MGAARRASAIGRRTASVVNTVLSSLPTVSL
jgi:hypothetical protein